MDIYQGAVASLVPFFVAERAYGYATVAGIVSAASLLSSVAQPLFGALTDRWPMPWLLPVSTILGGLGIALSGVTASYGLTLVFVAVSGVGVAAYHPESARVARLVSEGSHSAMGWFSLGGNLGFAAAPLMVTAVVASGGLRLSATARGCRPSPGACCACPCCAHWPEDADTAARGTAVATGAERPALVREAVLAVVCRAPSSSSA